MSDDTTKNYGWNDGMGMSLHDKIRGDLKTSMLNRDETVKSAIRVIMSEFPKITVPITLESGKKTTLELKKEETSDYLQVLEKYLPKMASKDEILAWVNENIDFSQFKNAMQAMGPIMKHFGKLADGNLVKQILHDLAN